MPEKLQLQISHLEHAAAVNNGYFKSDLYPKSGNPEAILNGVQSLKRQIQETEEKIKSARSAEELTSLTAKFDSQQQALQKLQPKLSLDSLEKFEKVSLESLAELVKLLTEFEFLGQNIDLSTITVGDMKKHINSYLQQAFEKNPRDIKTSIKMLLSIYKEMQNTFDGEQITKVAQVVWNYTSSILKNYPHQVLENYKISRDDLNHKISKRCSTNTYTIISTNIAEAVENCSFLTDSALEKLPKDKNKLRELNNLLKRPTLETAQKIVDILDLKPKSKPEVEPKIWTDEEQKRLAIAKNNDKQRNQSAAKQENWGGGGGKRNQNSKNEGTTWQGWSKSR